jgi:Leucine rich repeat
MGQLKTLKVLKLDKNSLKQLPQSMSQLSKLTELSLSSNYLQQFPDWCMQLKSLTHLRLGNNQLHTVPYTIGHVTALQVLELNDNPLDPVLVSVLLNGMPSFLWECRRRYSLQTVGEPPTVTIHSYGIQVCYSLFTHTYIHK